VNGGNGFDEEAANRHAIAHADLNDLLQTATTQDSSAAARHDDRAPVGNAPKRARVEMIVMGMRDDDRIRRESFHPG